MQEAAPFIKEHGFIACDPSPFPSQMPFVAYAGTVGDLEVIVAWNGRGSYLLLLFVEVRKAES